MRKLVLKTPTITTQEKGILHCLYVIPAREGSHVTHLNFLSLIVGFAVTVAIWLREVVSCRDFILRAVSTFWAMSLVGFYPGRASLHHLSTVI